MCACVLCFFFLSVKFAGIIVCFYFFICESLFVKISNRRGVKRFPALNKNVIEFWFQNEKLKMVLFFFVCVSESSRVYETFFFQFEMHAIRMDNETKLNNGIMNMATNWNVLESNIYINTIWSMLWNGDLSSKLWQPSKLNSQPK